MENNVFVVKVRQYSLLTKREFIEEILFDTIEEAREFRKELSKLEFNNLGYYTKYLEDFYADKFPSILAYKLDLDYEWLVKEDWKIFEKVIEYKEVG